MEVYFPGPIKINKDDYDMIPKGNQDNEEAKKKLPYFLNPFVLPNSSFLLSYFNVGIAM